MARFLFNLDKYDISDERKEYMQNFLLEKKKIEDKRLAREKKLEEEKYLVLLISPEDSGKSLVVDSNLFEEVIYE